MEVDPSLIGFKAKEENCEVMEPHDSTYSGYLYDKDSRYEFDQIELYAETIDQVQNEKMYQAQVTPGLSSPSDSPVTKKQMKEQQPEMKQFQQNQIRLGPVKKNPSQEHKIPNPIETRVLTQESQRPNKGLPFGAHWLTSDSKVLFQRNNLPNVKTILTKTSKQPKKQTRKSGRFL